MPTSSRHAVFCSGDCERPGGREIDAGRPHRDNQAPIAGPVLLRLRLRYVSKAPLFVIELLPRRSKIKVRLEFQGLNRFALHRGAGFFLADLT